MANPEWYRQLKSDPLQHEPKPTEGNINRIVNEVLVMKRGNRLFLTSLVSCVVVGVIMFVIWLLPPDINHQAAAPNIDQALVNVINEKHKFMAFEVDEIIHKEFTKDGILVFYSREYDTDYENKKRSIHLVPNLPDYYGKSPSSSGKGCQRECYFE
ncbi:hypothetical protein [Paenibacillus sp. PL2-23]|uniref:hypothetical protein n=1 Tax=Paenibacillus sp. PL2-23 TaxID=2100729 RepID=UPI0030FBD656